MTKKDAQIKAIEYILNTHHAYSELNDELLFTDSQYDKVSDAIDHEISILEGKLRKLIMSNGKA